MEKAVDGIRVMMGEKINNHQSKRPEGAGGIEAPCFDSSSSLSVFKFQFESAASRNGWDNREKSLEVILALKVVAAEILETMPASCRNNYSDLMMALQRKFCDETKREL